MKSAFLIAATSSGCGKTTFSLGLMRALIRKGKQVQPYKCGPDYIDTQFQTVASQRKSINLDLYMSSENHVRSLFCNYSNNAEISIVEGAMGMFDGYNGMKGSSADIACVLGIPVVLLINASSAAYSVAATIYGFLHFCENVKVVGVIFNRVASENHFSFLKNACADVGVECLGYIKKNDALQTPSRHLGLTLESMEVMNQFIDAAANEVEKNVDIDRLLAATTDYRTFEYQFSLPAVQDLTMAVARDEAFNFIYPANLNMFTEVKFFSPIRDEHLPPADIVYFPGGYPELYAEALSANTSLKKEIKEFSECGGRILGECGGLIYLCEEIDGHEMCGIFPLQATMKNCKLTLGYRTIEFQFATLKGHEFHYSNIINPFSEPSIAAQINAKGEKVNTPVYRHKNTIAGYTHLYWAETGIIDIWKS